jgi:hypothetical protein
MVKGTRTKVAAVLVAAACGGVAAANGVADAKVGPAT